MMTQRNQSARVEWDAVCYHRLSRPQFSWGQKVLNRLRLRGDETVLDAGCGTGRLTVELAERLPRGRVIAVDQSERMLRVASDGLSPELGRRVGYVRADLRDLPLDGAVNLIFSTATLHWVRDQEQLFQSLFHALKPKGWLIAQCGGGPNLARVLGRAQRIMVQPQYRQWFANWSGPWEFADAETAAGRLRRVGFADVSTSIEPAPAKLADANEYGEFLTNVIFHIHLARIPDEALRRSLIQTLVREAATDNPPFVCDYWRLNLTARRPR